MDEQNKNQDNSSAGTVEGAVKTGKAVAKIAKGAATGQLPEAALHSAGLAKKAIPVLIAVLMIPVLVLAMLPSIIFGNIFGTDGTDTPSGFTDDSVMTDNMTSMNTQISTVLSEGLTDVLSRIDADFATSGCDEKVVNNPYGADVAFNANYFISMYCASKDTDVAGISVDDMVAILQSHKDQLYSFTSTDSRREEVVEPEESEGESEDQEESEEPETVVITTRTYNIAYNGESYFADTVFSLSDEQKSLANDYARNLSVFLNDGVYQVLSDTGFSAMGLSYDGVAFTDGATQVVYYNQLDERWKDLPYGTDDIGNYACGPTSMAIVISSLTSETVDPPHMAQWSYEHGGWCSRSGSYHSLIPNAARAWGLPVEGCTAAEPQRIVDALADGKLVVALMGKGHFTSSGHFIVLRGVTSEGKILVADPASYNRSDKTWDLSLILDESGKRAGAGGPFWIIG